MSDTANSTRSTRKAKGEGHERRGEILTAAERIFVEKGYEGATIRKIADEVGLSSTALYMHFADKGEILNEICRNAFEGLLQRQMAFVCSERAAIDCVKDLAHGYVAFGLEHPNAYRLAFMAPTPTSSDGIETVAQKTAAQLYGNFVMAVGAAIEAGELKGEPKVVAQVLWASVHGIVSLLITKPSFEWVEHKTLVETQIQTLLKGFAGK